MLKVYTGYCVLSFVIQDNAEQTQMQKVQSKSMRAEEVDIAPVCPKPFSICIIQVILDHIAVTLLKHILANLEPNTILVHVFT